MKVGKTYCYHPVDLVAPDGEHGPVDGPGVGVEADTDLQGNVWGSRQDYNLRIIIRHPLLTHTLVLVFEVGHQSGHGLT